MAICRSTWANALRHVTSHTVAGNALPAVTDLHRCDLTKEQRDEHIRRYAELLEMRRAEIPKPQNAAMEVALVSILE